MALKFNSVVISSDNVTTGENIIITVMVEDVSWNTIKDDFTDWNEVSTEFNTWNKVLNYT